MATASCADCDWRSDEQPTTKAAIDRLYEHITAVHNEPPF